MRRASGSIAASPVSLHTSSTHAAIVESHVDLFDREARGIRQRARLEIDDAAATARRGDTTPPGRRAVRPRGRPATPGRVGPMRGIRCGGAHPPTPTRSSNCGSTLRCVEILLGERARGSRMARIVARRWRRSPPARRLRLEREQPFAGREEPAEAGFLRHDGAAGGEITDAAIAEPAAARRRVAALGHADLALRALHEGPVAVGRVRHARGIDQRPAVRRQVARSRVSSG